MKHHASSVKDTVLEVQTASVLADSNVPASVGGLTLSLNEKVTVLFKKIPMMLCGTFTSRRHIIS